MSGWSGFPSIGPREGEDENQWDENDWQYAFHPPSGDVDWRAATPPPKAIVEPITPAMVSEVTHIHADSFREYSDQSMCAVMRLHDGRWASVETWSDSTGYGCHDGSEWHIGATLEDVVRWGLSDKARRVFGLDQDTPNVRP